ncbi:MAG: HAD family phosphatase [Gemmatimonadota bacterium]|nr:HAD family phosphatase [Gemmatimonadota bacterium]
MVEALLFDLGGVVIEIDFDRVLWRWETISALSFAELKSTFHFDTAYQRHERGEIDGADYFAYLRNLLKLDGSDDEIVAGWNAVFVTEIPTVLAAISKARKQFPCYAFTNTNPTHLAAWQADYPAIFRSFDKIFISFDLGLRKPERLAFDAIVADIGVAHANILFFDDTRENIAGAEAAGLQTVYIQSPDDIHYALENLNGSCKDGILKGWSLL